MENTQYFEYNNGIYPCPLCIAVGRDWHNDDFDELCNRQLEDDVRARTYDTQTKEGKKCVLIRFANKKAITMEVVAHEALHAALFIFDYIGCEVTATTSEPAAYLLQWIARGCEDVKLGKTEE
ncbi:MAG: hypothetical protein KBT34_03035 [Prevotella sp.]|nr:hypothetical protein [Candidatus Prevotella equi]